MKTLDVESVKTLIQSRLSKTEKLLSCSQAHGTESIYVAITKDTYYYKIFRLSGHQALQSFGQETVKTLQHVLSYLNHKKKLLVQY